MCYEGGLDENGIPADTRTELQRHALYELLKQLRHDYPQARIAGHCELPGTTKPCPCYNCSSEYKDLQPHLRLEILLYVFQAKTLLFFYLYR